MHPLDTSLLEFLKCQSHFGTNTSQLDDVARTDRRVPPLGSGRLWKTRMLLVNDSSYVFSRVLIVPTGPALRAETVHSMQLTSPDSSATASRFNITPKGLTSVASSTDEFPSTPRPAPILAAISPAFYRAFLRPCPILLKGDYELLSSERLPALRGNLQSNTKSV